MVYLKGFIDQQVVEDGYEFFAKRQLVTLFSAPNYCGEFDNAGAMMSVDETLMCSFQILKVGRWCVLHLPVSWCFADENFFFFLQLYFTNFLSANVCSNIFSLKMYTIVTCNGKHVDETRYYPRLWYSIHFPASSDTEAGKEVYTRAVKLWLLKG